MKVYFLVSAFVVVSFQFICAQNWLNQTQEQLKILRGQYINSKADLIFLIDTSGSLTSENYEEEKKFVTNLLNEISVSMEATRVEVIPFGNDASIFIDYVSAPELNKTKCTFNEKFSTMSHAINGWQTNMKDAFQLAYDVTVGKYSGEKRKSSDGKPVKTTVLLLTDGKWNWPWDNSDPTGIAQNIHKAGFEVFAIGVGKGINYNNLKVLTDDPTKQAFYLQDFTEFAQLATYIRGDPHQLKWQIDRVTPDKCLNQCDPDADCACGLVHGGYFCACPMGYAGSGQIGQCTICPPATYKNFTGRADHCTPCPPNSGHTKTGRTSIIECKCNTGYRGDPGKFQECEVRRCDPRAAPTNGTMKGVCTKDHQGKYPPYNSTCTFECDEGFTLSGSSTSRCTLSADDAPVWSGSATCTEIVCPEKIVKNANPQRGTCTSANLGYKTNCSYACATGYNRVGSETITCQLDRTWAPLLSPPSCQEVQCQALPKDSVGSYSPANCSVGKMRFNSVCHLLCPDGYHIKHSKAKSDSRQCHTNGTWQYKPETPTCTDWEPPTLDCPGSTIYATTDKGQNFSTVSWKFNFTDNSLIAKEPDVTKNGSFTVIMTINDKNVETSSSKLMGIGLSTVKYNVTDKAGNTKSCSFNVEVRDNEPPTCGYCPTDILKDDVTVKEVRVNWNDPICTDNSGDLPEINSDRKPGDVFSPVPGRFAVQYIVNDFAQNVNRNCSFTITLKVPECKLYPPPKNGALTCQHVGSDLWCAAQCKEGYDFTKTPPWSYTCEKGTWNFFPPFGVIYSRDLPWPDCAKTANPNNLKMRIHPVFYFQGDCQDPNTRANMTRDFLEFLRGPFVPSSTCGNITTCNENTVKVYCGNVSVPERRRRRSPIMQVDIRYDSVITTNLAAGSNDQKGQDAFNAEKANASQIRNAFENSLQQVNWVDYKAKTGLELKDGDIANFNVDQIEAYCSENGAVVRKCDEADLNCGQPSCKCTKDQGTITKCTRCPVGTFYDVDADDCLLCAEGTYSPNEGAFQCINCPEGTWTIGTRQENFTACTDECGPGLFSSTGIAKCFNCPIGTYSSEKRNKACISCPKGTFTVINAAKGVHDCGMQCAPGTYSDNGVEPCLPCPVGTYQPGTGQTACLPCPGQESTHGTGASSLAFCGEVDTCVSSPCMNGGTCVNTKESYRCDCAHGYNGVNCEIEIDECLSSPCYQASTCVNKVNAFKCLCTAEYTGIECELPYSLCTKIKPCVNGMCIDKAGSYSCQCSKGYGERFCEMKIDECASNPCQNNGVCFSGLGVYTCKCQAGYTGLNCQINIDDCAAEPCQNGGTCVDGLSSYSCQCPVGYTGANCEHVIDYCAGQPCENGGTCVNKPTGFSCTCKPSYYGCHCRKELSPNYDLSFQVRPVQSYSKVKKPIPNLIAITIAFWMRTRDTYPGTVISYATEVGNVLQDNAIALQDYASFVLFINNQTAFTGLRANDGQWHHVAVTWESADGTWHAYKDGVKTRSSTEPFQQGEVITGDGVMILGQEQDELGDGFNTEESFNGEVSQMNIFDHVLSANDIYNLAYSCDYVKGNVAAWGDFREQLFGEYHLTDQSYACDFSAAQRKFSLSYNTYISGSDDKVLSNSNPESCASSCLSEAAFICRSFEFENSTNTCRMSTKTLRNGALASASGYRLFELNCLSSLGVSTDERIPNANMTASSRFNAYHDPLGGRLNYQAQINNVGEITQIGGWAALTNNKEQWIQITFGQIFQISGVATQGRADAAQWVTTYKLQYSTDGSSWTYYSNTLTGNTDQNTVVRNEVRVFQAMYLRFRPQTWNGHISMRVEVYGCPPPVTKPADITNECSPSPCQNGGTCVNRYNAYLCVCHKGYSGKDCETATPCKAIDAPIYGTKSSSNFNAGSTITLTCNAGYSLQGSSSRTCQGGHWTGIHPKCLDKDECTSNPCNQWCKNTYGSYICHCHKGYQLQGSTTCVDINECSISNGGCSHTCHNSAGSFTCSCPTGLELYSGKRSCKDIDECASSNGGCEHTCVNTYQSFYCVCSQGYTLRADKKTCAATSCPSLSPPPNGNIALSSGNVMGSTATYTCANGYRASFAATRYCQADGQWSGGEPSCIRVFCEEIGQVEHATRVLTGTDGGKNVLGTKATFTCHANFRMPANVDAIRTCQKDGTWSGTQPRCVAAFCSPVPVPTNGTVQGFRYELNATLRITCNGGYNLVPSDSSFRTCISDGAGGGKWSGQDPVCQLVDCGDPGNPYGGLRNIKTDTKYQSTVTYTCNPNHHLEGEISQVCQADGQWSGSKPVCLERSCGNPGVPVNGWKNSSNYKYGDSMKFQCNVGYTLSGSAIRTCQDNGLWTGTQPTCEIVSCGDPGTPTNGVRYGDTFTYQSTVLLECDPQYKLTGDRLRVCQADGSWTGSQPTCNQTSCGQFLVGPSGTVNSPNYPSNYNDNEYCTWQIQVPVNKKIRLDFTEFKTETGKDYLIIYDTNHYQTPNILFDGTTYKPPPFTSSGNVLRLRFISDGATTFQGFSFNYKQVDTTCGGVHEDGSGTISSPDYPNGYAPNLDCVWLVYRTQDTVEYIFTDFKTESTYDKVAISEGRFGETVMTNGWSGHLAPSDSFRSDTYLWIRFTSNGGNSDGRFHKGWTGTYQKYWPYSSKKRK